MAIITCPKCGSKNRVDENRAQSSQPVCGKCGSSLPASTAKDGHPIEITDATLAAKLSEAGDRPVLVDCWAEWCPPCRMLSPTIDAIAAEANGRWVIGKLDVDQNQQTAARFKIDGIPAMLIFKRGELVEKLVGLQPKEAIVARLNEAT
jgi:thioredoxin